MKRIYTAEKHNSWGQRWKYWLFNKIIPLGSLHLKDMVLMCQLCSCVRSEKNYGILGEAVGEPLGLFSSQNTQHMTKRTMALPWHPAGSYMSLMISLFETPDPHGDPHHPGRQKSEITQLKESWQWSHIYLLEVLEGLTMAIDRQNINIKRQRPKA